MINWCLEVWGDYACFTRPEMKVERVSYDVITPSAARAIFEAIMWKPAICWKITKIEVLKPIKNVSVRRNEVGKEAPLPTAKQLAGERCAPMGLFIEEGRQQKAGLLLKDVHYRLHGYFEFIPPENRKDNFYGKPTVRANGDEVQISGPEDEKPAKYAAMFERRAKKGQCFHRPYLGCREFACNFKLVDPKKEPAEPINVNKDLGFMLYDMDFSNGKEEPNPLFFRAHIKNGVINTDRREIEVRG
ncbi:MAG: type I-C CRISPR-associated protein Cas5c [Bacillota bacterium]